MATTGWENQNTRIIEGYVNRVYGQGSEHNTVKELVKELHASGKWMIHGREDEYGKWGFFLSHTDYFDNVDNRDCEAVINERFLSGYVKKNKNKIIKESKATGVVGGLGI